MGEKEREGEREGESVELAAFLSRSPGQSVWTTTSCDPRGRALCVALLRDEAERAMELASRHMWNQYNTVSVAFTNCVHEVASAKSKLQTHLDQERCPGGTPAQCRDWRGHCI
ncbi:UNVERIFIED_CONTAM: hypothetical protein FKN15_058053 [Acipenser sinensis]